MGAPTQPLTHESKAALHPPAVQERLLRLVSGVAITFSPIVVLGALESRFRGRLHSEHAWRYALDPLQTYYLVDGLRRACFS